MSADPLNKRPAFWRTTAFKLTAAVTALFTLAAVAVAMALYWSTSDLLLRQYIDETVNHARKLQTQIGQLDGAEAARFVSARQALGDPGLLLLANAAGTRLAGNLTAWPDGLKGDGRPDVFEARTPAGTIFAVGLAITLPSKLRLVVARDARPVAELTQRLRSLILLTGAGILGVGALVGYALSLLVMRRIATVTRAGERFMRGAAGERVPMAGTGDEFDDLARNLNAMFARIEQLMAGMKEVSDNIAHDLKTPLNRLRIRAEEALAAKVDDNGRRQALEAIVSDTDEIIRTFNALLQVARLEAGLVEPRHDRFDMTALVRDICELYEPVAEETGGALRLGLLEEVSVGGHRQLIGQAVTNLIENALKYGANDATGAPADVTVSLSAKDGEAVLVVADRGPGIPADQRESALRRFVRLDQSRSKPGTGLGLALVAAVARGHHGRIVLLDNAPGLAAQLRLPLGVGGREATLDTA